MNEAANAEGALSAFLLTINSEPVAALLVGLLLGVLLATGRGAIVFTGKLIRSLRTGKWDSNGAFDLHALGTNQQAMMAKQAEIATALGKIAEHQVKNYQSMRELIGKQADHDSETAKELAKMDGKIERLLDRHSER